MMSKQDHTSRTDGATEPLYRIGEFDVSVRSDLRQALDDFAALYPGCGPTRARGDRVIRMEVRKNRRALPGSKRYSIYGDGERIGRVRRAREVLPQLEWGINWRLIQTRPEYLQVHAATLARAGRGVVLAGTSGSGKSTLAAGLLSRGWAYFSDEFALIDPHRLQLHPFPKAVCIKAGSFDVVRHLKLRLSGNRHYAKAIKGEVGYISPSAIAGRAAAQPCPIHLVLFPRYTGDSEPRLFPVSRARAAFALAGQALNRNVFGHRAMEMLKTVVEGAQCFGLEAGPIDETCDLVESLLPLATSSVTDAESRAA